MEYTGIGASDGTACAQAIVFRHNFTVGEKRELTLESAIEEFNRGRRFVYQELCSMAVEAGKKFGPDKAGIYEGYAEILMDEEIEEQAIKNFLEGLSIEAASQKALDDQASELEALENSYMKERGSDLADIGRRLAAAISGKTQPALPTLTEPCVLIADELSPFETVRLDHSLILGIAMDKGGATCHVAILAKSLNIPCVVGLGNASEQIQSGMLCAIDGGSGKVIPNPDSKTAADFRAKENDRKLSASLIKEAEAPVCTLDGVSVMVCANIGSPQEAKLAHCADGVGLFRTEFLFMGGDCPSEDEQFEAYRQAAMALDGKPLTIRTLDIGGDKDHPALGLKKEENPFLGYRAIRHSLDNPGIFKSQLRAILRAAYFGNIEIMFPMAATLGEFRRARAFTQDCFRQLVLEGIDAKMPPVGLMIETPAAAILAEAFAKEADFFSIGTNDLTQYTLAADRGNPKVAALYDPLDPAVLRLLEMTCNGAKSAGISAGMCGELASEESALPLLIGLKLSKLSVSASRIPAIKAKIKTLDRAKCEDIARHALALTTAAEVHAFLKSLSAQG